MPCCRRFCYITDETEDEDINKLIDDYKRFTSDLHNMARLEARKYNISLIEAIDDINDRLNENI